MVHVAVDGVSERETHFHVLGLVDLTKLCWFHVYYFLFLLLNVQKVCRICVLCLHGFIQFGTKNLDSDKYSINNLCKIITK